MALFAVSTDSTSDLKKAYCKEREIFSAPLTFTLEKNGEITESLDNFATEEEYVEFYKKVSDGAFPRTAKLNYDSHVSLFTKIAETGVKEVIHVTISSGLANTYTIAEQAAEELKKEYPDFKVYVLDPLTATVGQGMLATLAADFRDEGMSAADAYEYLLELRQQIQHCIIPVDLFYLKKGGRVSAASAAVGTVLNIKPMLIFDEEGKLKTIEKCKGIKKAYQRVIAHIALTSIHGERGRIIVVHTNNEQGAEELAALIESKTGVKPSVTIMGPVIGAHVGPGSVSCCWLSEKSRGQLIAALAK